MEGAEPLQSLLIERSQLVIRQQLQGIPELAVTDLVQAASKRPCRGALLRPLRRPSLQGGGAMTRPTETLKYPVNQGSDPPRPPLARRTGPRQSKRPAPYYGR